MSAAEKLKALDRRMQNTRTRQIVTTPAGYDLFVSVSDALPQIVAVVEAAEGCFRIDQPSWNEVERRMAVALAALDEQLGDVT